jgi:hypothetical protein
MSQPLRVAGFELIISGRFWVTAKVSVLPKVPIGIQMKAQLRFMPTHPSKEKIEGWGTRHPALSFPAG